MNHSIDTPPVPLDTPAVIPEVPLDLPVHPGRDSPAVSGESDISPETSEGVTSDTSVSDTSS